jgi:hypothetical protein
MTTFRISVCAVVLAFTANIRLASAAYTFTNIVDSTTDSGLLFAHFAIEGSTVAVKLSDEVFKVEAGVRTTIAKQGDPAPSGDFPSLFSASGGVDVRGGTVVFRGQYTGGSGIFTGSGGPLTTIAKTGDASPVGAVAGIAGATDLGISGNSVAFTALVSTPATQVVVFRSTAGTLTPIAKTGDPAPSGTFISLPFGAAIGGNRVATVGGYGGGGAGLFTGDGGALTTIAKRGDAGPGGTLDGTFQPFAMSGDTVAFEATAGGVSALFTGSGGPLTRIVKVGDPAPTGTFSMFDVGGIANNGSDVLFSGDWTGGGQGLFLSSHGATTSILQRGNLLFGQSLIGVAVLSRSLDPSGSGNVAFRYTLANGVSGIALATPVPEPAALTLALAALAPAIRRRGAH